MEREEAIIRPTPRTPRARVTVRDVAAAAGVSVSTVVSALAGRGKFRKEMVELVGKTAHRLGYRPHTSAKAMRTGRYGALGVLLSTNRGSSILPPRLFDAILDAAADAHLHISVAKLSDAVLTAQPVVPLLLRELMCDGLLINYNAGIPDALLRCIDNTPVPAVWINSRHAYNCVFPDDEKGARQAVAAFVRAGHRHLAFVDFVYGARERQKPEAHYSVAERLRGFEAACLEAGVTGVLVEAPDGGELRHRADDAFVDAWLLHPDRPSAALTYTGSEARWLARRAQRLGVRIPGALSVLCFEDDVQEAGGVRVGAMLLPQRELGWQAVELLRARIAAPERPLPPRAVPFGFDPGETLAPPAHAARRSGARGVPRVPSICADTHRCPAISLSQPNQEAQPCHTHHARPHRTAPSGIPPQ